MPSRTATRSTRNLIVGVVAAFALILSGCSQPQHEVAAAPQQPPFQYLGQWGVPGDEPGQLHDPVGPAVDTFGRVYLASRGTGRLQKYDSAGVPLISFDAEGVRRASGIAVDSGGGIYIAEAGTGEIHVYFPEGDFLRTIRIPPQRNLLVPLSFSIATDGAVILPDAAGGRVEILSSKGAVERVWRVPPAQVAKLSKPTAAVAAPDGFIYVGDSESNRILKYTREGMLVTAWDDSTDDPAPLLGLAVSSQYVFMLRGANPRLVVWTLDGKRRLSDNLDGRLDAAPRDAGNLAINLGNELVVLDPSGPRVLRFRIHL
jgi:DNA-binding beta-propeller fold protein YncE